MKIGDWEARSCLAGKFRLDGGAMFGVVPKTLWSKVMPSDEMNRIPMVMRPLLIRGKGRTILVDVGAGLGYGDKYNKIYAFEDGDDLAGCLCKFDVDFEDVTDVVLTHLHFDHAAAIAYPDGDEWRLLFPNAVHHVQRAQYEHGLQPNARDRASYYRHRIDIMERENVLSLHDGEWSLDAGIDFIICHGHTPGQQLARVSAGGKTLLYCGDLIPTAAHFPTPYIMAYDLDPVLAMEEKESVLQKACGENWVLYFEHDPDVIACYVEQQNGKFVPGEKLDL
jgi:glyoxylase-like metal-dependent hydrolase (beta-lactamase superfamily II)